MRAKINKDSLLSQVASEHKAQQIWTNGENLQNLSLCVLFKNAAQIPLDLIQMGGIKEDCQEAVRTFGDYFSIEFIYCTFITFYVFFTLHI